MKKNLNIAYLNGAEGMIRRGTSSGGSGSGGSGEANAEYYRIDWVKLNEASSDFIIQQAKGMIGLARYGKADTNAFVIIAPVGYLTALDSSIVIESIEFYPVSVNGGGNVQLVENLIDYIEQQNASYLASCFIPITKEEFYNTNA